MSSFFDSTLAEWKEQIDGRLKAIIDGTDYPTEFKEVLDYALFPGGKRLRPILCLCWHELYAPVDSYALDYACGIEILHSYSLIHDDMPCMDNDEYRRGKLTVHAKYGEGKALLAGDALLDLAYSILNKPTPRGAPSPFCLFSGFCGDRGLIHGQYIDLFEDIKTLDSLLEMYRKKTGALISLACISGYLLGNNLDFNSAYNLVYALASNNNKMNGVDVSDDGRLVEYVMATGFGDSFGCAFQIYDDLSEYISGEPVVKTSVLNYIDLDEAKKLLNKNLNDAARMFEVVDGDTRFLRELLEKFVIV